MEQGKWYHLALRWDGTTRSIVINGEQVEKDEQKEHAITLETKFYVGARSNVSPQDLEPRSLDCALTDQRLVPRAAVSRQGQ